MNEVKGPPSIPEELGVLKVEQGDVIERSNIAVLNDPIANITIGKPMHVERLTSDRRAMAREIKVEKEQVSWGVIASIPERHLSPQYYKKLTDEEIPELVKKLIEAEQE